MGRLIVQKYGGTCVGSMERIARVADKIAADRQIGKSLAVVVSAMAGETDRLVRLAEEANPHPPARELDALLTTGEQTSAALLAMALSARGIGTVSLHGGQIPIRTDSRFGNAQIRYVAPQRIHDHLKEGKVVVVTGFQGVNDQGEMVTLGRGGSDLTAVALSAALEAEHCEIYTDVPGVFTADPGMCGDARPIRQLSYDEMLELASLGAKVLQARAVQLAKRYQVSVQVRSAFDAEGGTWVKGDERVMEGTVVSAITCDRNESKLSVRRLADPVESATNLFSALADSDILVDVIVQDRNADGKTNLTFTVPRSDFEKAKSISEQLAASSQGAKVIGHERVAKVSAVGLGMRSHTGVAADMFRTLAAEKIEVMAVSTSDIKISCVIDDRYAELAVRVLHDAFGLAKEPN